MVATALSRASFGTEAPAVYVEVHIGSGLSALSVVGLPEAAVRESKDRVRSAIATTQFEFPEGRITVNLAPADLPKEGGRFDLPIALGILAASGQIPAGGLDDCEFLGELALTGELRAIRGALTAALAAHTGGRRLLVPSAHRPEAALVENSVIFSAQHLLEVTAHLADGKRLEPLASPRRPAPAYQAPDLSDIRGQHRAKRALEIAAAGG